MLTTRSRRTLSRLPSADTRPTIGLLAGSGRFPILFAEAARRQGLPVACVGIKYEVPEELRAICDSFQVIGIAKLGGMIRAFRRMGVKRVRPLRGGLQGWREAGYPLDEAVFA